MWLLLFTRLIACYWVKTGRTELIMDVNCIIGTVSSSFAELVYFIYLFFVACCCNAWYNFFEQYKLHCYPWFSLWCGMLNSSDAPIYWCPVPCLFVWSVSFPFSSCAHADSLGAVLHLLLVLGWIFLYSIFRLLCVVLLLSKFLSVCIKE